MDYHDIFVDDCREKGFDWHDESVRLSLISRGKWDELKELDGIKPVETCKHKKLKFIGLQRFPNRPELDLKLYDCNECHTTITNKTLKRNKDNPCTK